MVTHAREHGAHVSTIALARPHTPRPSRSKFGAAGIRASSLPEAGPTPPLRPGWLPAVPPTSYPRPPRRGAVPSGRSLTRARSPNLPVAGSPRHGPGPLLTMAAARHSTLDFMLGAKGEGAWPPPARPPLPPRGLGTAGDGPGARRGANNARCGTACTGGPAEAALHLAPRSVPAALRSLEGPCRAPLSAEPPFGAQVTHPRPTRSSLPPSESPLRRWAREDHPPPRPRTPSHGAGVQGRWRSKAWIARGRPRDLFPFSEAGKSPPRGRGLPSLGLGKDRAVFAELLGDCVGNGSPGKGRGTGKGNDYYGGGG